MNLLSRAFAQLSSSPSAPRRRLILLHPVLFLHHSSSLYSTDTAAATFSKRDTRRKPKSESSPSPSASSLSRSSAAGAALQQNVVSQTEKDKQVSGDEERDWPRPSEIPWQAKVVNSVNLIGHVQMPVQFQTSPDGKYWAGTIITHTFHSPPLWIPIIFEGDLAHIAVCHLKEHDYVHIAGQLNADPPPFTINQGQANVQVMVHSINFVQESFPRKKISAPRNHEEWAFNYSASMKNETSANQSWKDLLAKPHEWWDIRLEKGNSMGAAFERKNNGELLSMNESTPEWIRQKLEFLTFDHKSTQKSQQTASMKKDGNSSLSSWIDLLNNSKQWRDCRKEKLNGSLKPRHPDFKHKDGGFPLWINSAPGWVLSELERLEFDTQIQKTKQVKDHKDDKSWKDLVENPDKWWDNRLKKNNIKSPDFKHKDTREGLWLTNSPAWVSSKLPPVKTKGEAAIGKRETLLS